MRSRRSRSSSASSSRRRDAARRRARDQDDRRRGDGRRDRRVRARRLGRRAPSRSPPSGRCRGSASTSAARSTATATTTGGRSTWPRGSARGPPAGRYWSRARSRGPPGAPVLPADRRGQAQGLRRGDRAVPGGCAMRRSWSAVSSGGRDSVCLLRPACRRGRTRLGAARQLWAARRRVRGRRGVLPRAVCAARRRAVRRAPAGAPAGNVQAWARDVRYAEAERLAAERDALIAVGHTATDQLETVLYRLAASPGRRALLGMPERSGRIVRPLLRDHARADRGVLSRPRARLARGLVQRVVSARDRPLDDPARRCANSIRPPRPTCWARWRSCATRPSCSTRPSTPRCATSVSFLKRRRRCAVVRGAPARAGAARDPAARRRGAAAGRARRRDASRSRGARDGDARPPRGSARHLEYGRAAVRRGPPRLRRRPQRCRSRGGSHSATASSCASGCVRGGRRNARPRRRWPPRSRSAPGARGTGCARSGWAARKSLQDLFTDRKIPRERSPPAARRFLRRARSRRSPVSPPASGSASHRKPAPGFA